jgi:SAM-dependent methyltransferase
MSGYHASRLTEDPRRGEVWRALWRYFFRHRIGKDDCVLDLGAGYGDFINNVVARRRIAVDMWDGMRQHLEPGVEAIVGPVERLDTIGDGAVDYAFASNVFEHITQDALVKVLAALKRTLSVHGRLTILQPNYRYAFREYFDDYTHVSVYSHISLPDFLRANGWDVLEVQPRFLPLTVKSRLPTWPILIAAYLKSPIRPMGKQMLVVARPGRP